jgi:hypothetical protein
MCYYASHQSITASRDSDFDATLLPGYSLRRQIIQVSDRYGVNNL